MSFRLINLLLMGGAVLLGWLLSLVIGDAGKVVGGILFALVFFIPWEFLVSTEKNDDSNTDAG